MKKGLAYICSMVLSLVLCVVVLFIPLETGVLWKHPCVNICSLFAAVFLVMNTVGVIVSARGADIFAKPYTKERPAIEQKKNHVTGVVMAFFEVPLLATVFFVDGGWKMVACSALYIGGALMLASLIGEHSVYKMRKEFHEQEQCELAEQIKKEEG
ncbi:MAG: hypothetical protein IJB36_05705 [Clostridia bacterium]|nr:hypothetical protein [Clostridia bacterium]